MLSGLGAVTTSSTRAVWVFSRGTIVLRTMLLDPSAPTTTAARYITLIGFDQHLRSADREAFYGGIFLNEESALTRLAGQPGIEFMPADGAEGERAPLLPAHAEAPAVVIEMRPVHVDMRHFPAVQSQGLQDVFSIRQQAAAAQFRARVAGLLQDQGAPHQLRCDLCQVQRRGNSGRACADDDDVKGICLGQAASYGQMISGEA